MRNKKNNDKTSHYEDADNLGPCPICGRALVKGASVEYHHLRPKSKGGRKTLPLHAVCHRMLHKTFSENTLAEHEDNIQALCAHPEIAKFVQWVMKKPPEFTDLPRTKGRTPYHRARR